MQPPRGHFFCRGPGPLPPPPPGAGAAAAPRVKSETLKIQDRQELQGPDNSVQDSDDTNRKQRRFSCTLHST